MSLVKWVKYRGFADDDETDAEVREKFGQVPVIPWADLKRHVCAYCKAELPYKNGFHSGHPKSRDYFKACDADAMFGDQLEAHRKEGE